MMQTPSENMNNVVATLQEGLSQTPQSAGADTFARLECNLAIAYEIKNQWYEALLHARKSVEVYSPSYCKNEINFIVSHLVEGDTSGWDGRFPLSCNGQKLRLSGWDVRSSPETTEDVSTLFEIGRGCEITIENSSFSLSGRAFLNASGKESRVLLKNTHVVIQPGKKTFQDGHDLFGITAANGAQVILEGGSFFVAGQGTALRVMQPKYGSRIDNRGCDVVGRTITIE